MSKSTWTPSIVPSGADRTVYLVVDDFAGRGRAWRETDVGETDLETVVADLLSGQYNDPIRVVALPKSGLRTSRTTSLLSCASGVIFKCATYLSSCRFVDRHEGRFCDIQMPLPMRLV
jgi:hypothetical protein